MSLSGIQESTRPFPHVIYTDSLNTQEEMVGFLLQDYFYVQLVNMASGNFWSSVYNVCNYLIEVEFSFQFQEVKLCLPTLANSLLDQ